MVWGLEGKARKVAYPLHVSFPFWQGTVDLNVTEHLRSATQDGCSVSGRVPWTWLLPATPFESHAVTSLSHLIAGYKRKASQFELHAQFTDLQFLNTKLSMYPAFAHIPDISHPNVRTRNELEYEKKTFCERTLR